MVSTSVLEIRVLGELEIRREGRRVTLPASKRTRALLGYLVVTGRPHLRSHLCDLLWPTPDDPRAALRWSLAKLRPLLEATSLQPLGADRERVSFDGAGVEVDWTDVSRDLGSGVASASTDALRRATARFRGELLEGLELPECFRYHEWCVAERATARSLRLTILETLMGRLADDPEEALACARARLGVDPLDEAAHGAVIRLLGRLGRTSEAVRQYEACKAILAGELSASPSPELEAARRALGQSSASPRLQAPRSQRAPVARACPPFVGRLAERRVLADLLAQAASGGEHPLALVLGEPGIGKTRLLNELAEDVRGRGGLVLAGRAFEAETVRPYGAWIDALRSPGLGEALAGFRSDLAPLLPELGPAPAGSDRNRLFDAVVELLASLGADRTPAAVVLDDLQWLDEAGLALLHYAARALRGARVVLACAARPGELSDNAAALGIVRALAREGRLTRIELAPLDELETARLATADRPGIDVARVYAESAGNPLFALEVARALARGDEALSDTLDALIDEHLARLDETARDLLPWAAALGRGFDLETLARVSGSPPAAILGAVEELERHRILRAADRSSAEAGYDFAHDLVRRAAYRGLSDPRRRLVHSHIARALQELPDPDGTIAADVAHHAALGGESELAASACVVAGQRCLRLYAYAEASALSERGLPHVARLPRESRLRLTVALLQLRIHSAMRMQDARRVESLLSEAAREAQQAGLDGIALRAFEALAYVHWYQGDFGMAHADTLRAADASRGADPTVAAQALARTARCLAHLERDLPRAEALMREARGLAEQAGAEIVDIPWGRGLLHLHAGEYDAALPLLEQTLALARRAQDRYPEWDSQARLAMIELERDRPERALDRCRALRDLVSQMSEGSEPAFTAALEALARQALDGADALEGPLDELRRLDSRWMLAYVLTFAASHDLQCGRAERAGERAAEAYRAADAVGRRSESALARAILARLALARGDTAEARGMLEGPLQDLAAPHSVSLRARRAVAEVAEALRIPIPTPIPTRRTTASP
jgi:DNA-binding SARP family transcriptional activator/tetratricopeptide (TPR) repeat protein